LNLKINKIKLKNNVLAITLLINVLHRAVLHDGSLHVLFLKELNQPGSNPGINKHVNGKLSIEFYLKFTVGAIIINFKNIL